MSSNVGRNELCPCGSGKKHKNCCYKRGVLFDKKKQNKIALGVLAVVVVLAGIIAYSKISSNSSIQTQSPLSQPPLTTTSSLPSQTQSSSQPISGVPNTSQPPGPAPAGKVWSTEHGHWHDAPTTNIISSSTSTTPNSSSPVFDILPGQEATQSQFKPSPQPPGPVPPGKVWSAEHGHWHNIESGNSAQQTPQPPGPAPAGKVWSAEHGHWHDAPIEPKVIQVNPTKTDPK